MLINNLIFQRLELSKLMFKKFHAGTFVKSNVLKNAINPRVVMGIKRKNYFSARRQEQRVLKFFVTYRQWKYAQSKKKI